MTDTKIRKVSQVRKRKRRAEKKAVATCDCGDALARQDAQDEAVSQILVCDRVGEKMAYRGWCRQ
jgi:hypothetical protein